LLCYTFSVQIECEDIFTFTRNYQIANINAHHKALILLRKGITFRYNGKISFSRIMNHISVWTLDNKFQFI